MAEHRRLAMIYRKELNPLGFFIYAVSLAAFVSGLPIPWWSAAGGWIAGMALMVSLAE